MINIPVKIHRQRKCIFALILIKHCVGNANIIWRQTCNEKYDLDIYKDETLLFLLCYTKMSGAT